MILFFLFYYKAYAICKATIDQRKIFKKIVNKIEIKAEHYNIFPHNFFANSIPLSVDMFVAINISLKIRRKTVLPYIIPDIIKI